MLGVTWPSGVLTHTPWKDFLPVQRCRIRISRAEKRGQEDKRTGITSSGNGVSSKDDAAVTDPLVGIEREIYCGEADARWAWPDGLRVGQPGNKHGFYGIFAKSGLRSREATPTTHRVTHATTTRWLQRAGGVARRLRPGGPSRSVSRRPPGRRTKARGSPCSA